MLETTPIAYKHLNLLAGVNTLSIQQEKTLFHALQLLNDEKIDECLNHIFEEVPDDELALNVLAGELISIATRFCYESGIDLEKIGDHFTVSHLVNHKSFDKQMLKGSIKDLFHAIILSGLSDDSPDPHKPMQKYSAMAVQFIEQHYSENIQLKDIADHINITETYLSKVFREETGEPLSKFLARYRIDKSIELLQNGYLNMKHLYSMVGFNSYNYFFNSFKKHTGCTPTQYRKKLLKKNK